MVKLSGKSILHTVSHGLTIQTKYEAWKVPVLRARRLRLLPAVDLAATRTREIIITYVITNTYINVALDAFIRVK